MKNVITKVQQTGILSFTHSLSMMGSDTHVVNVTIKQLGRILSNSTWQPNMMENNSGVNQSVSKNSLKLHTQSKHDGIRCVCGECGYQATQKQNLKTHIMTAKHGRE